MNVLDLFSGIGGFSLGLERAGMHTVAFCEIDPWCRRVLAKHWPDVPVYDDVRTLTAARLVADAARDVRAEQAAGGTEWQRAGASRQSIDVICGGFPCQDISTAGKGAGITGERSGLWKEYARIIGEVRPRYAIIENVAALLHRGLSDVLFDLSALGYDAEWHCIRASDVGAPHRRDRVWIIAYPQHPDTDSAGPYRAPQHVNRDAELRDQQVSLAGSLCEDVADANGSGGSSWTGDTKQGARGRHADRSGIGENVADADQPRLEGWLRAELRQCAEQQSAGQGSAYGRAQWLTEPDVGRVAHGVPARVDRLRSLGNAVVPQIPEIIGRAIMAQSTLS